MSSSELKLKHQILTTPHPMCLWEPHSVLLESSRSSDLGVDPRIDLTELGACGEALGSSGLWRCLATTLGVGASSPPAQEAGGAQASLASGDAQVEHILETPPQPLCLSRGSLLESHQGLHCCWKEAGPLPLKLLLLLGSHGPVPCRSRWVLAGGSSQALSTSVHSTLSQSGADRDHRPTWGFCSQSLIENVGCSRRLVFREGAGAGIVSLWNDVWRLRDQVRCSLWWFVTCGEWCHLEPCRRTQALPPRI